MVDISGIVRACQRGEGKSQRIIYDMFKKKWMGICVRYVRDKDDAKDVFQDSSLRILSELGQLKDIESFEGWARRIVVNTSLNFLNRKKAYMAVLDSNLIEAKSIHNQFGKIDLADMDTEYIIKLINSMPDGYRTVFNLSIIDGYSHSEISEVLGITQSTSRSQLYF